MQESIPEPLRELVDSLGRLPGLGPKSALRCAMTLLKWPEAQTRRLGAAIHDLRDKLCLCGRCGGLAAKSPCPVCADASRQRDTLMLVADWDSLLTIEQGGFYQGQYLILGGMIDLNAQNDADRLDLQRLFDRLAEGEVRELVLALGATLEADNTSAFVREMVQRRFPAVTISRLAQGIPLGAEVKFMDRETLRQSLKFRQPLA